MNNATLTVRTRDGHGKQAAKHLRSSGWTPAVLYGGDGAPLPVQVEAHALEMFLRRGHLTSLISVTVEGGETTQVLLREPVRHPVTDELLHVDMMRVSSKSRVTVEVPIELVGTAKGFLEGGIVDQVLHDLEIECLATEIPESIKVDVAALGIGDHIAVSALDLPGIRVLTDPSATIVTISAPRAEVVEVAAPTEEVEEVKEPEVVGRRVAEEAEEEEEK